MQGDKSGRENNSYTERLMNVSTGGNVAMMNAVMRFLGSCILPGSLLHDSVR
jgi:hypothetical protein